MEVTHQSDNNPPRIGNNPIKDVIVVFGETGISVNGSLMRDLCTYSNLKVTIIFFRQKEINKIHIE